MTGGNAELVVGENGTISVRTSNDTMPFTYRGPAADTIWGDSALVWQNALGATVAWENGADVVFDGSGAAGAKVAADISVGTINFNRSTPR